MENTNMYIPDSCMPEGFGADPETMVWDYSFVLKSSQDEAAFLEENREALEELGYSVSFVENHSENFWASVTPMRQSATFSAVVFAGVLLLGLVLAAFLYLLLRRRDFAILRAMGVPNGPAARGLLGPVALLGLLGIAAGSIPAWGYAMRKTAETLATISGPEGGGGGGVSRLFLGGIGGCGVRFGGDLCLRLGAAGGLCGHWGGPPVPPSCLGAAAGCSRRAEEEEKDIAKATATGGEARKSVSAGEGAPNGKCANLAGADRRPQGAAPGTGTRHGSIRPVCTAADPISPKTFKFVPFCSAIFV